MKLKHGPRVSEEAFLDVGEEKEIDQSNVHNYISRYLDERGLEVDDIKGMVYKSVREELIKLLMEKSNLSLREIATVLGLNREMVRRSALSKDLSETTEKVPFLKKHQRIYAGFRHQISEKSDFFISLDLSP